MFHLNWLTAQRFYEAAVDRDKCRQYFYRYINGGAADNT
jgi:hypothetical protein